jgi:hypothetical protein
MKYIIVFLLVLNSWSFPTPDKVEEKLICKNGTCKKEVEFTKNQASVYDVDDIIYQTEKYPNYMCFFSPNSNNVYYQIRYIHKYQQTYRKPDLYYAIIKDRNTIILKRTDYYKNEKFSGYFLDCKETPFARWEKEIERTLRGTKKTTVGRFTIIHDRKFY